MSTAPTNDSTASAAETTTDAQPARSRRRWPWVVALVVVAALGATGTGVATASAASANEQLAVVQEDMTDLETRSGILESSLNLIRDHRDRLELQLEEQTAELEALQAQVDQPAPAQQG